MRQKRKAKMAENRQTDKAEVIATKRGFPIYDRNPSVPSPNGLPIRMKPVKIANGNRALIIGKGTGELLGEDTVLGRLARHTDDGRLSFEEMFFIAVLLLLAGNETTTNMLSTLFLTLAQRPDR